MTKPISELRVCRRLIVLFLLVPAVTVAEDGKPSELQTLRYRVTGLFSPDRQEDLRETMKALPEIVMVSLDYENSEAAFSLDPAKVFPGAKPEQIAEQFDGKLKSISYSTFGIRPLSTTPRDHLKLIEIPVAGLDCKACCLAAYESIYRTDGVERATASFKEGLVTALIDPQKTNQPALEELLKKSNVALKGP